MTEVEESASNGGTESALSMDLNRLVVIEPTKILELLVKFKVAVADGPAADGGVVEDADSLELVVVAASFKGVKRGRFRAVALGGDDDEMTDGRFATRKVLHFTYLLGVGRDRKRHRYNNRTMWICLGAEDS